MDTWRSISGSQYAGVVLHLSPVFPPFLPCDFPSYPPISIFLQGYGSALWQVYGFFLGNGASGYVKKPQFLLTKKEEITGGEEEGKLVEDPFSFWNPKYPGNVKKILKVQPTFCFLVSPLLFSPGTSLEMFQVRLLLGTGWREAFGESYYDRFSLPDFYAKVLKKKNSFIFNEGTFFFQSSLNFCSISRIPKYCAFLWPLIFRSVLVESPQTRPPKSFLSSTTNSTPLGKMKFLIFPSRPLNWPSSKLRSIYPLISTPLYCLFFFFQCNFSPVL